MEPRRELCTHKSQAGDLIFVYKIGGPTYSFKRSKRFQTLSLKQHL